MQLRAITIQQPWAWAIAAGHKRVENRTRRTNVRGMIAIHAGQSNAWMAGGLEFLIQQGLSVPHDLTVGAVVALAELVDCAESPEPGCYLRGVELVRDPFAFGPWCYVLANVRPLKKPIACRGQRGWFTVDVPHNVLLTDIAD